MQQSTVFPAGGFSPPLPASPAGTRAFKNASGFGKKRALTHLALLFAGLMLMPNICMPAENPNPNTFRGVINDFTPTSDGGPWELRGHWSLTLKPCNRAGCKADFSAALTMVRSDQGVVVSGGDDFNNTTPAARMAHTHHITLVDGQVTNIAGGIEIKGSAMIAGNGAFPPPFQKNLDLSSLTIDITGGNAVAFSNIALTFGDQAASHFGTAPLHGVVRGVSNK
jgi:hypothetical protein